ncbi:hypothetical protein [Ensifer soli]|uniref:hypothetical protein n=1 Tax=Ciceribacter sp. sgz301302 TaxID=3342379 RepID=UPI0035BB6C02
MNTAALLLNAVAFSALLVVQTGAVPAEKPCGIRRALQTYAGQLPTGAYPTLKPLWQIGVETSDTL